MEKHGVYAIRIVNQTKKKEIAIIGPQYI